MVGNTDTPVKQENATESLLKLSSQVGQDWVELTLPILTVSEANGGRKKKTRRAGKIVFKNEHWTDAHKRHKKQKGMVALMLRRHRKMLRLPCHITFTRYAPDKLDRLDNLPMAFKWILDAVCEIITGDYRPGRADDTEEIDATFKQVHSKEYGVKILIRML